ncbi:MAG TPA: hypothetical protein VMU54_18830, partial [Planctomycetota bacterium]|nr:hypothetical protein [Planctomycetota bacterium]
DLLKRIEGDDELQAALLPEGVKPGRRNAFEIAILWLDLAREQILDKETSFELTQMGLYLYPDSMDGYIRYCLMLAGMYEWKQDHREEAKAYFLRARRQCEDMMARAPDSPKPAPGGRKYKNLISTIFAEWSKFYALYPEIIDLEYKARSRRYEDELELLKVVQGAILKYGPIDEAWLWSRYNPHALLNRLKQSLAKGEDVQEFNDAPDLASPITPGADPIRANLAPPGLDVDYYSIPALAPPAPEGAETPATPPRPLRVKVRFSRPQGPCLPLKVTLHDLQRKPLRTDVVTASRDLEYAVPSYGSYLLKVESNLPDLPWPPDTRYGFAVQIER